MKSRYSEELMDIVNEKDEIVGKASQEEIYTKHLAHRIVHVLLFNKNGEIALQLRSKKKKFTPGHWSTSAGGHVQSGETYEQAASRECEEELGFKPNLKLLYKDIYNDPRFEMKKFLETFKVIYSGQFKINPKEVEKIEFFSLEKIQKMIDSGEKFHPELLFLLEKHFGIEV